MIVIVGGSELASVVGGEDEVLVLCVVVWLLTSTSPLQRLEVQVQAYEEESIG